MRAKQSPGRDLNLEPTNDNDNTDENEKAVLDTGGSGCLRLVLSAVGRPNTRKLHGRVVVGGWVSSPAGQNRRTVGHCGRTKLLLHAHCFDTLGDPIKLNANANKH